MTTYKIIAAIYADGGFDNFNNWNYSGVVDWVFHNYNCSKYVARKVAAIIS